MSLNTGEIIGDRYRVIRLLGQGGMGAVYQAWDTRLNHPVAVKEMSPQAGLDPGMLAQLRQQFQQEAQVLATLVHPNLVRVTDYFSWGGNEYLVMDFVEGESLAARIRREGALPEQQVIAWAVQLLDALGYCHRQGVLHRDIKPQNIIITPEGRAVLVDFGLVKLWDPNDPRTRTVMRGMGTPEYAPPEQYDTGPGHTDPRSDIYGLGATLYHALTGKLPPTATQRMASPSSFLHPRRINSAISPATEAIVLKAMEIEMDRRFRSADEMAQALGFSVRTPTAPARGVTTPPAYLTPQPGRPTAAPRVATAPVEPTAVPVGTVSPPVAPVAKRKGIFLGLGGVGLAVVGVVCLGLAAGAVILALTVFRPSSETTPAPAPTATRFVLSATNTPRLATHTPTPPEVTEGQSDVVLLFDDFSSASSGWEVSEYSFGSVSYRNGAYVVKSFGDGATMWGVANQYFDDVVIDVDTLQVSAPANNNNAYGVVCRDQGSDRRTGYYFFISGDGMYAIATAIEGDWKWLVEWTASDVIRQGNAVNHIQAICDGELLILTVNGRQLATARDSTYSAGDIALAAASLEAEPTEIHFDNLVVTAP